MRIMEEVLTEILNPLKAANVREYLYFNQMSFLLICLLRQIRKIIAMPSLSTICHFSTVYKKYPAASGKKELLLMVQLLSKAYAFEPVKPGKVWCLLFSMQSFHLLLV